MRHALRWEFPGGKLEEGETPEAALKRELAEELGIGVLIGRPLSACEYRYPQGPAVRLIPFLCSLAEGAQPSPREHGRLIWLPWTELKELDWVEADVPIVHEVMHLLSGE